MAGRPMPFLTGPAKGGEFLHSVHSHRQADDTRSIIPLSKTQLALWLDYLRRPNSSHYLLTLEVDISNYELSIERIIQTIHGISCQHPILRATFHADSTSDDIANSYMAIHSDTTSVQDIQVVYDKERLHTALRDGFNLSISFPVRWVISVKTQITGGQLKHSYSLFLVGHHIAVDGSSMSQLSKELLSKFSAGPDDTTTTSIVKAASYGDYIHEQEAYLRSSAGAAARDFWLSQVQHTQPFTWTAPKPTSTEKNYRSIDSWCFLSNDELKSWSNSYGTSWFRIATSIIGLITAGNSTPLPHHDHALSVAFGGRPKHFAECISHMANTMPVKFPLSSMLQSNATFSQTVKAMGKNLSQAKKHELYPFMTLMQEAQKTIDNGLLNFKVAVTFSPKLASQECTLYPVEGVWDLFFCFLEHDDGVSLGVIVDPQVFSPAAVGVLKQQFIDTVALSQRDPSFRPSELPFLRNRELASIIPGLDIHDVDAISSSRIHDWINARALAQPNATALSSAERGQSMTYREMTERAHQTARYLQKLGIGRGDAVLLQCDRGFKLVLWIIAILEVGAYYIVIDKDWPLKRKEAIMRVAEPSAVVTDSNRVDTTGAAFGDETKLIVLEKVEAEIAEMPRDMPQVDISNYDLAYVVFTSGSTGQPKGVMVEHANLSHYVSAARDVVKIGPHSQVLQFASFAFDASILEWAVTLAYGGTLCFVDHPQLLVGEYLADVIEQNQVNFFHTTPSVLSTIPKEQALPSLRLISVGGEPSPPGLLAHWGKKLQLLHAYGPTETTVIVTVERIPESEGKTSQAPDPTVIGRVFPNSTILICAADNLEPLADGTVGEICIAGPQVSRGYKGQEELTKSKFHEITLSDRTTRLYRTGDKGYLTADGKLCIGGRMNNRELKVRGYRVDLHEIEQSILTHNQDVTMTSVQLVEDSLVALVVPSTVNCDIVRQRLMADVPAYAVPAQIIALPRLPLNPNGKVDHNQATEVAKTFMAPSKASSGASTPETVDSDAEDLDHNEVKAQSDQIKTKLIRDLHALWAQVLGTTRRFASDVTFFDAGGHSLSLLKLHSLISERFPRTTLSLLDIFSAATINKQAEKLLPMLEAEYAASSNTSSRLSGPSPGLGTSTPATSVHLSPHDGRFAIVGMSCCFPGGNSLNEFWDILMEQKDGVSTFETPMDLAYELGKDSVFVPRHGTIRGLDDFQPEAWSMTDAEAEALDPQKRLFLDVAAKAIKDARLDISRDVENNIGVYVGAAPNTYLHQKGRCLTTPQTFESHYKSLLDPPVATLAAYKLNLTGPNVTLDTACSSSLTALSLGLTAIREGNCDTALIGGVSIAYPQEGGYVATHGQVFSPSGQCQPFDSRADGAIPADGAAAIIVKRLDDAVRDGDAVYAVLEGHAIGSDGMIEKAGFTVPSATGQSRTVAAAILQSGVSPETIRYVETHGSGTPWGDALEVQGLRQAMNSLKRGGATSDWTLRIGSNKGNFGNAEAASGLLSLIKASLGLSSSVIPPLRELKEPNSMCAFDSRLEPVTKPLSLDLNDRVGVTSLGFGGSNAHVILASAKAYGLASRFI